MMYKVKRFIVNLIKKLDTLSIGVLTFVSFYSMPIVLGIILYHLFFSFDILRVVSGCMSLITLIYLNKNLRR